MNRTPNTTAINNTTSPTPQTAPKTINYAAAAKKNSTQLPQSPVPAPSVVPAQQQQSPQQSVAASQAPQAVVVPSSTQQQQTNAPIAVNGTKNQSTSSASFAVTTKNTPQQSQILPTNGITTTAKRSSSPQTVTGAPNKGLARTSSVTLPKQASLSTASSPIHFGSFHQTTPTPLSTSPVQPGAVSGGPLPSSPTTSVVNFGTFPASNATEEVVQPTPTTSSQAATAARPPVGARIPDIPRTHSVPPQPQSPDNMNSKFVPTQASLTHQRKDSTHSNHSAASLADGQSLIPQQTQTHVPPFPNHHQGGHHLPTQQHYQTPHHRLHQNQKHGAPVPMGANNGPNPTGFSPIPQYGHPHQAKKQMSGHSPHLPSASAPAIPASQTMPMVPPSQGWNPQMGPGPFFPSQPMYDHSQFYVPQQQPLYNIYGGIPRTLPAVAAPSRLTANAPTFVPPQPQPKISKAIKIINPDTMAEIKTDVNPPPGSPSPAKKEPSMPVVIKMERPEDKQEKDRKEGEIVAQKAAAVTAVTPGSPAMPYKGIKIVDPAKVKEEKERKEKEAAEREEKERKEREEKEREEREREEKEREEKERKEREEEERIAKEEAERKEREERERKEREEKEREEKERIEREEKERIERETREREEQERKEREEQERKEKEEHDRLEREENERKEKEEKERLEKERLEKERLETERLEREKEKKAAEEEAKKKAAEVAAAAKLLEEKKLEEEAAKKETEASPIEGEKVGKTSLKLDLSTIGPNIPRALATPLRTPRTPGTPRRTLEDLNSVQYPPNVKTPNPANPEPGKFRYDRAFLMQFMDVCTEKPETLPALMDIVIEENPSGDKRSMPRKPTGTNRQPKTPSAQTPGSEMGSFKLAPRTSEERFTQSSMRGAPSQMGSFQGGRPLGNRTGSGSNMLPPGMGGGSSGSHRENSQGGRQRKQDSGRGGGKGGRSSYQVGAPTIPMEQVVPLEVSENRWVPTLVAAIPVGDSELIPIEVVTRKVKGLLNKLTLEKFDTISDQIIEFANQSVKETDGATLKAVIQSTFEKATDEPNFAVMYAQLARKMLDKVSVDIKDDNVKDPNGKVITGGNLFRKYLLNRCQEDFERGWKVDLPKVDKNEDGTVASSVDPLLSEEYYVAAKAKRRGLGLIKFIGELFRLQMLTERIMHECIKKLLSNVADPEEEETESLCKLMTTVGKDLDHKRAKGWMDVYFDRMGDLLKSNKLPSRIKFMIQDVIDLRSTGWIPRRDTNAPKTIQEIHEDAQKAKEDEKEMMKRTTSSGGPGRPNMTQQLSRGSSHRGKDPRGGNVNVPPVPAQDGGWSTVGSPSTSSRKTGDLTNFGKMDRSKNSRVSLGPTVGGVFASLNVKPQMAKTTEVKKEDKTAPMTPTGSQIGTANMFSALNMEGGSSTERRRSIEEPAKERKKLNLLPRGTSTPISENTPDLVASPLTETPVVKLTEVEADKKIASMLAEFWSVVDVQELVRCIGDLGNEYHTRAISKVLEVTIDRKEDDVKLMAKVFWALVDDKVVTKESFKKSFGDFIETLDDISIDVPQAYKHTGILLIGARIELVDLKELQKPLLSLGGVQPPAAKLTAEYLKALKADAGEQAMVHHYQESAFDFKSLFSEDKQTDEALNNFLERQDLSALRA